MPMKVLNSKEQKHNKWKSFGWLYHLRTFMQNPLKIFKGGGATLPPKKGPVK